MPRSQFKYTKYSRGTASGAGRHLDGTTGPGGYGDYGQTICHLDERGRGAAQGQGSLIGTGRSKRGFRLTPEALGIGKDNNTGYG